MREQLSYAKQTTEYSKFSVSQGIESGGTARYTAEYFCQDHPIHRTGEIRLCDARDSV